MKSFKSTAWLLPQPVLIIGTYDKESKPNAMNAAWGGQWDMNEIVISLGSHQTTDNLCNNGTVLMLHEPRCFGSGAFLMGKKERANYTLCAFCAMRGKIIRDLFVVQDLIL